VTARRSPVFEKLPRSPNPLTLPPAEIGANREKWIEEWTDTTLR
jgi:ABC-type thiamine transport system substrate-binding protein